MDFSQLDLKSASEAGSWLHLTMNGQPLGTKEAPCRILLRGMGAPSVTEAMRKAAVNESIHRTKVGRTKDSNLDALEQDYQRRARQITEELILAAVVRWEGIGWGSEPLECTPENVLKICGPGTTFFQQVYEEVMDRDRLFKGAANA